MRTDEMGSLVLRVTRSIRASRERVFEAWIDPDQLTRWMAPEGFTIPVVAADPRVGGSFRIQMRAPDGATHTARGSYVEVRRPTRLVFSWSWEEAGPDQEDTLVTVELEEHGDHTEVILVHERFASEEDRQRHEEGWVSCLAGLEAFITSAEGGTHA